MKDFSKAEKIVLVSDISGSIRPDQYWIDQTNYLRKTAKEGTDLEKWEAKMRLNCEYSALSNRYSFHALDLESNQVKIMETSRSVYETLLEALRAMEETKRLEQSQAACAQRFKQSKSRVRRGPGLYWRNR